MSNYNKQILTRPTIVITILCLIAYIPMAMGMSVFGSSYTTIFGYHQYYRLVTAMFCHAGIMHLLCNMISLNSVGPVIEQVYGKKKFYILYFATGICAGLFSALIHHSVILSVGASGAICGLIGAYLAVLKIHGRLDTATLVQVMWPILIMVFVPGIDNVAHLCGALSGYVVGRLLGTN